MKVLILRFSSIGDIVLTTPVIRAVKQQLGAEVHFLTKEKFGTLLSANPNIDRIHTFDKDILEVKKTLIEEAYDFIIDLHKNFRSGQVKRWLGTSSSSFSKLNIEKWMMVNGKIDLLPDVHIVDRYFAKASDHLDIKNDGKGLDFHIADSDNVDVYGGFEMNTAEQFVCLVLGATYFTKRIPITLVERIVGSSEHKFILIGGPEEKNLGDQLAESNPNVKNACGAYSIAQSASIIEQSSVVITGDTGMMHIAAAFKKPIIMVWGSTIQKFGMGPYETDVTHFKVDNLSCRPCSKLGYDQCPKGHFRCMNGQDWKGMVE